MKVSVKIALTIVIIIVATVITTIIGLQGLLIDAVLFIGIFSIWNSKRKGRQEKKLDIAVPGVSISTAPTVAVTINSDSFAEQKKTLLDLKNRNILTDSEYEKK
jgi:hypothetical protein